MRTLFRVFLAFLLYLPFQANAAYSWYISSMPQKGYFSSASQACESFASAIGQSSKGVTYVSDTRFSCRTQDESGGSDGVVILAQTSSCDAGTTFNKSTGACDKDSKCKALAGQTFAFGKTVSPYVSNGGSSGIVEKVNYDGCEGIAGSYQCNAANDGSDKGYCLGTATYTGNDATSEGATVGNESSGKDPNPPSDTNCGKGYTWSGTTCVKDPVTNPDPTNPTDPGTGGEGGEGGDTGTGGGGSGGGSGGDGTGGDGDGGTGTGGDGGTGTGGDGDSGDGDEGDDPEPSKVGGEACNASLTCSGDAIQCAILRQQRLQQCQTAEWNDYSKAKDTINSAVAGKEYQLGESKTDISSGFDTGTRFLSAGCPAPKSYHSEAFGRTYQISYQPACDYASTISALALAFASLFFIVYVGRGFGGD